MSFFSAPLFSSPRSFFSKLRSLFPQQFSVAFLYSLCNTSEELRSFSFVLPLPQTTPSQRILTPPSFSIPGAVFFSDPVFLNTYAVIPLSLKSGASINFQQNFEVATAPIRSSFPSDLSLPISETHPATLPHLQIQDTALLALKESLYSSSFNSLVRQINDLVKKTLVYGNSISGLYSASQALSLRQVDCGGFSSLAVALANACGLDARIVSGFFAGYKENRMHAWLEIKIPNTSTWIPLDVANEYLAEQKRTNKLGELGFVGSDRIIFSKGCDVPLQIGGENVTVDILQNPFVFPFVLQDKISLQFSLQTKRL
jgi:transglutaminase-like putative cysteine protease